MGQSAVLTLFGCLLTFFSCGGHVRVRRDFMYVSATNETDPRCFQKCNERWREKFEYTLNVSANTFYEFPLHPILLDYSSFLLYCTLSEQKTHCYIHECNDMSADTIFSPSNFICDFKRNQFSEARPCLADAEPITFLKCDQECHKMVDQTDTMVYSERDLDGYERELDTLCTFQQCYVDCMIPIVKEVCIPSLAARAIDIVTSFVSWHARDIYEWHVVSDRLDRLAPSCLALVEKKNDPIIEQLITA